MGYFQWINEKIKTMTWQDIGVLKLCVMSFTLLIAKFWAPILSLQWQWYAAVFIFSYVYLIYKIYLKKV